MNQKGKNLAIWGIALQLGTVVGLFGTIIGMVRAFGRLAESETAQPAALANDISIALYTTAAGSVVALVGIILILVALFGARYRAPWFRTVLWVLSILWLLSFPIGTILGIIVMVYLVNHKAEFTEQTPAGDVLKAAPEE
jgi:hypothetical protein